MPKNRLREAATGAGVRMGGYLGSEARMYKAKKRKKKGKKKRAPVVKRSGERGTARAAEEAWRKL